MANPKVPTVAQEAGRAKDWSLARITYNSAGTGKSWLGSSWLQVTCLRNPELTSPEGSGKSGQEWMENRLVISTKQEPSHWIWGMMSGKDWSDDWSDGSTFQQDLWYQPLTRKKSTIRIHGFHLPISRVVALGSSFHDSATTQLFDLPPALFLWPQRLTVYAAVFPLMSARLTVSSLDAESSQLKGPGTAWWVTRPVEGWAYQWEK